MRYSEYLKLLNISMFASKRQPIANYNVFTPNSCLFTDFVVSLSFTVVLLPPSKFIVINFVQSHGYKVSCLIFSKFLSEFWAH